MNLLKDGQEFAIHFGDCIPHMRMMPECSVDLSIYSPPFPSLYAYTDSVADIGNSEDVERESKLHLSFFFKSIRAVIKPGRVMVVHCANIPRMKRAGGQGLFDFHGMLVRLGERAGFIWEYSWAVRKNPQAQAIRTKSRELQFAGLESDRARSRGSMPDYLIKFTAPGTNLVRVQSEKEVTRNNWIDWAEHCWTDIKETDTLNVREAKGEKDTKHICPLQLGVIERLVKLFSNPGEIVFSPFTGIGSEGYMALKLGRRFYGCELKKEYHEAALRNCSKAVQIRQQQECELLPIFRKA